jgi:hypothetical protein
MIDNKRLGIFFPFCNQNGTKKQPVGAGSKPNVDFNFSPRPTASRNSHSFRGFSLTLPA